MHTSGRLEHLLGSVGSERRGRAVSRLVLLVLAVGWSLSIAGCKRSSSSKPGDPAEPAFSTALFSAQSANITHSHFPHVTGSANVYQATTADGVETSVLDVLDSPRVVAGVECAVFRERVYLDGLLREDSVDWYAQDSAGNVWYFGKETTHFEYDDQGVLIGTDQDESWEADLDVQGRGVNAEPGIVMKARFVVGDSFKQESYPGLAEDRRVIVAIDVPLTLRDGTTYTCLKTRDSTPLAPGSEEHKYFAPGVGFVFAEVIADPSEREELQGRFDLGAGSLPDFDAATFSQPSIVTHARLPFIDDTVTTHFVATEGGLEVIVVEVVNDTRIVNQLECAIIRDRVYVDGVLVEDTYDWYAQDDDGNVWYMGEDATNYEYDDQGQLIGTDSDGSWEAGVDGAEPGIILWDVPVLGASYLQEFYEGEAEDMAIVIATDVEVALPDGTTFEHCWQILEWTPLEPGGLAHKYYAPGIGLVLDRHVDGSKQTQVAGTFDISADSLPELGAATFTDPSEVDHSYFPLSAGAVWEFEKMTDEGLEVGIIEVQDQTQLVYGIECAVVRHREYLDGVLMEDTYDWYAQDDEGNVWYMGEDVTNFTYDENGDLIGTDSEGSWEAGVDDAEPGIIQWDEPVLGVSYRQEFYEDEAEDMAVVVASGLTVEFDDGTRFDNCWKILEWTPLEPASLEYKYYAPAVGLVLEEKVNGDDPAVLVSGP
ncbi:MAG: hypothetical protein ACKVX7_15095 [Planctomycetota bacterium]